MANFCLIPAQADKFIAKLRSGEIDPYKLNKMTSEERRKFFSGVVGEDNAKGVNALFESKILLKNQKYAYTNWAKKVAGITPEVRRDLISRIGKMDRILNPDEEKTFLADLASTKLGLDVTVDEAKQIATLSKEVQATEAAPRSTLEQSLSKKWQPTANDMRHAYAKYDLHEYVNGLKTEVNKFHLSDIKGKSVVQAAPKIAKAVADNSKALGASLDDSFALRQGYKSLLTHPILWQKEFRNSFVNIAKAAKNTAEAKRELTARLMADPSYDQAVKDGLRLRGNEDAFPTSAPEKIPLLGRAFGATEVGYNAFAQNLRLAIYKNRMAAVLDKDVPKNYGKNMAALVNSLTGSGGFGSAEKLGNAANVAFYSLRFLKSNVDTLLNHPLGSGVGGTLDFARGKEGAQLVSGAQKEAAKNLALIVGGTAGLMAIANALKPGSVSYDPRSANFGKIQAGDTRFDISGGMGSIVELAAQLATKSTKSSTTGIVTKLNQPGAKLDNTQLGTVINFFANKASPLGGIAVDYGKGTDHNNNKTNIKSEATKLVTPLGISNYEELKKDPHSANKLAAILADSLGISTNTYGQSNKNFNNSTSAAVLGFKAKVSPMKFQQFNKQYNTQLDQITKTKDFQQWYNSLPDKEKQSGLTTVKTRLENKLFKQYGYKPAKVVHTSQYTTGKKKFVDTIK